MWWYRLMGKKSLITTIQVNFMLIPSEAEMRQHKLTWIVDCKLFAISLYHYSHFLATCPLWFHNLFLSFFMHTGHFEQDRIVFLQPGCFWMNTKSAVNIWPNFGKSTILARLTHKIFSSQKQPLTLIFYAMVGWIHSRYIKL